MSNKILALLLLLSCRLGATTAAPAALSATSIDANQTALLSWTDDVTVSQWYIYLGGTLTYQPYRAQTGSVPGPRRTYNMLSQYAGAPKAKFCCRHHAGPGQRGTH